TGSGVVSEPWTSRFGDTSPTVPMLAAAWPCAAQIWPVNAATDVLPLVPVTAAITCGWREKNFAAVSAKARRASSTLMNATPSGSGVAGGRSAMMAAAPDASACETKLSPSSFAPATATNRSPGLMARLSALTPARSSAAKRASATASAVRRSASFMATRSRPFSRFVAFAWCRQIRAAFRKRKSDNGLPPAYARQNQLVGGRQVKARLEPEQGGDAADNGAPHRHRLPPRGGEAVRVGRRLRLIEHDEQKVARLIGGQDRGEGGQHLGLRIAAADHLVRSAGLAADVIALHVGPGGGALLDVEAHQIAHLAARLGLDDLGCERLRLGFAALEEGWRHEASAVHQRADRHHCLQRRHRKPVTECDRHGVELGPALGHQWFGALGQFGTQPIELAHLSQEPFVVLDPEAQRHARGADIGGVGEDLRNREHAVLSVEIVDRELAVLQRMA